VKGLIQDGKFIISNSASIFLLSAFQTRQIFFMSSGGIYLGIKELLVLAQT